MGHTLSFNHKGKQTVPHFTLLFLSLPGLYQSLYQKHLHCEDSTESSPHLSEIILERIKARFQEKKMHNSDVTLLLHLIFFSVQRLKCLKKKKNFHHTTH